MSSKKGFVLLILLSLVSCAPTPNLSPRIRKAGGPGRLSIAQLVVIGFVDSVVPVSRPVPTPDSGLLVQLIKVETKVENVLKGRFDRNRLEFFYFEWADGGYSGPPLNMIRPGERGIYFLEKDGGVFRSINDVYLSNILLVSGQHEIPVPVPEDRIRNAIEEAILLPGQGVEFPGYLESLPIEAHIAVRWIGKDETVRILSTLLKNKDGRIRGRACIVLAEDPFGMRECLGALQNDAEALAEDRLQASRLIITRKQSTFENQRK